MLKNNIDEQFKKSAFEHEQNAQIQNHPAHAQSIIRTLLPIYTLCSVECFC